MITHAQPVGCGDAALFVTVDGATASSGVFNECFEDNNSAGAGGIRCPQVK